MTGTDICFFAATKDDKKGLGTAEKEAQAKSDIYEQFRQQHLQKYNTRAKRNVM